MSSVPHKAATLFVSFVVKYHILAELTQGTSQDLTWKRNMIQTGKPANLASFCSTEEKLDIKYYSLRSARGFDFQDYFIHIIKNRTRLLLDCQYFIIKVLKQYTCKNK